MPEFRITGSADCIEGPRQPLLDKPWAELYSKCVVGGCIKVLTPLEYHTDRQRRWYKGPCLHGLSDWNGDSVEWWDLELKTKCFGHKLLKTETLLTANRTPLVRLTIVGVGKRNMTAYIEAILRHAIEHDLPVVPPDPDLRA